MALVNVNTGQAAPFVLHFIRMAEPKGVVDDGCNHGNPSGSAGCRVNSTLPESMHLIVLIGEARDKNPLPADSPGDVPCHPVEGPVPFPGACELGADQGVDD